jgi:prolyl 4-hydroxylase
MMNRMFGDEQGPSPVRLALMIVILVSAILLQVVEAVPSRWIRPAFAAAGGGFGASSGLSKKGESKKAKGKKSKRGSILSEVVQVDSPATCTSTSSSEATLDKWGLPAPTTEDIFPPMPPGTELIPVKAGEKSTSLSDIMDALKDHIELSKLAVRFDEHGMEKEKEKEMEDTAAISGRPPMKLGLLHRSPPVLTIENFFTATECEEVQRVALLAVDDKGPVQVQSATFSALAQSKRTSTSWFCYYSQVPTLLAKAQHVLGLVMGHMEEPQIVRYKVGEEFSWHYDEVPSNQLKNGGQRLATLLVYLNDVGEGGGTVFRDLKDGTTGEMKMLKMKPKLGSALLFFPAFRDGKPDDRTLHKGEVAGEEKWIIQMWIHERDYIASLPSGNLQDSARQSVQDLATELGFY